MVSHQRLSEDVIGYHRSPSVQYFVDIRASVGKSSILPTLTLTSSSLFESILCLSYRSLRLFSASLCNQASTQRAVGAIDCDCATTWLGYADELPRPSVPSPP